MNLKKKFSQKEKLASKDWEHWQKTLVMLSRFWPLRGWGSSSEFLKKGTFVIKICFSDMLNEVLKICEKWYLLMEKLVKTINKRSNGCILQIIYKKYLQNLKYNVKRACVFLLIMVGILTILILSVKNRGVGGGFA